MKTLYLILTLWWTGLGGPWIPIDSSFNYNTYEEFSFQTLTSIWIYTPKLINTSSNLYLYGKATDNLNTFAYLRKQDMDENIHWFQTITWK